MRWGESIANVMMKICCWISVAMPKLRFSAITLGDLKSVIHLQEGTIGRYDWNEVLSIALVSNPKLKTRLGQYQRAIFRANPDRIPACE